MLVRNSSKVRDFPYSQKKSFHNKLGALPAASAVLGLLLGLLVWQSEAVGQGEPAPQGVSYFVSTTGSDTQPGTEVAPFASLKKFFSVAKPGDTCYIRGGAYDGHNGNWSRLTPPCSGAVNNWITVTNYPGETPVIDTGIFGLDFVFVYLNENHHYMRFSGLTLRNFSKGFSTCLIIPAGLKSGETVENEALVKSGQFGPGPLMFDNLHISYCGSWNVWGGDGKALGLSTGTHDVTIRDSEFDHCNGPGIFGTGDVRNIVIENVDIHDNSDGVASDNSDADGITFDLRTVAQGFATNQYPDNITIRNVRVWNCREDGIDCKGKTFNISDCKVWNVGCVAYKAWSSLGSLTQGDFTYTNCLGFDCGQDALKLSWMPRTNLSNCTMVASNGSTAELPGQPYQGGAALRVNPNDATATWQGYVKIRNSKFVQLGTGPSAGMAGDIQSHGVTFDWDYDTWYNAVNAARVLIWRNSAGNPTYHYYSQANMQGNPSAFYTGTLQEQHGTGAAVSIAPFIFSSVVPQTVPAGQPASFSAVALDPDHGSLTYTWNFGDGSSPVSGASVAHTFAEQGNYSVILTAADTSGGQVSKTWTVGVPNDQINLPPTVEAGDNALTTLAAGQVSLNGSVDDDGNPFGSTTLAWAKQSGPGAVTFSNAASASTTAAFSQAGTYVLRLTADDGSLLAYDELTVTVSFVTGLLGDFNGDGKVDVLDYMLWADCEKASDGEFAAGSSNDDGIVDQGDYTTWADHFEESVSQMVAVEQPSMPALSGEPALDAQADQGLALGNVRLYARAMNSAPAADDGKDVTIALPVSQVALQGTVGDEGNSNSSGQVSLVWTKQSGPGAVVFTDSSSADTTATFAAPGTYVLRLTADDGAATAYGEAIVTVMPASTASVRGDLNGERTTAVVNAAAPAAAKAGVAALKRAARQKALDELRLKRAVARQAGIGARHAAVQ